MSQIIPHTGKRFDLLDTNAKSSLDAQETNSLCCEAAGITAPSSSPTEALIPHEELREAAAPVATLFAQNRPPAQPAVGYRAPLNDRVIPERPAVNIDQIDERAEFEKEFPIPEGLHYCRQRRTYIKSSGCSTSDTCAREHYAYRACFAAWLRRAWKSPVLDALRLSQNPLTMNTRQERS